MHVARAGKDIPYHNYPQFWYGMDRFSDTGAFGARSRLIRHRCLLTDNTSLHSKFGGCHWSAR
jgi:hypothetical protein